VVVRGAEAFAPSFVAAPRRARFGSSRRGGTSSARSILVGADGRAAAAAAFGKKGEGEEEAEEQSRVRVNATAVSREEEYRNPNNRRDQVFSALSGDGGIKVTACTVRNLLNDCMLRHATMTPVATEALGRTAICALLMAHGTPGEHVVQISLRCDDEGGGPIRGVVAIASGGAAVRGYVARPALGNMTLREAIGRAGSVHVVKNHPDWPRPYNGITAIRHGDVDRDVGVYLAESEQRSCALAAACRVDGPLCHAAGGYLVERLPDADPTTVARVEENLAALVARDGGDAVPARLLLNAVTPLDVAAAILDGLDMRPLQQQEPALQCPCSPERLMRSLRLLPAEEVEDILEKEEQVEARCEFCGKIYRLTPGEVRAGLRETAG
jgi:molecular chaperone Hsp33